MKRIFHCQSCRTYSISSCDSFTCNVYTLRDWDQLRPALWLKGFFVGHWRPIGGLKLTFVITMAMLELNVSSQTVSLKHTWTGFIYLFFFCLQSTAKLLWANPRSVRKMSLKRLIHFYSANNFQIIIQQKNSYKIVPTNVVRQNSTLALAHRLHPCRLTSFKIICWYS